MSGVKGKLLADIWCTNVPIPTITGQSYSPDFMFLVKKDNGEKILNVIVETKDVENQT
jgi:type III restriction enzyme